MSKMVTLQERIQTATLFLSIVCIAYKSNKQDVEGRDSNLLTVLKNIQEDTMGVRSLDQNTI